MSDIAAYARERAQRDPEFAEDLETGYDRFKAHEFLSEAQDAAHPLSVGQNIVTVSTDRLYLCLRAYRDALEVRSSWQTPAGLLAGMVLVLIGTGLRDRWLTSTTWGAMLILGVVVCSGWLILAAYRGFRARGRGDFEMFIQRLKYPPETQLPSPDSDRSRSTSPTDAGQHLVWVAFRPEASV